MSLTAPARSALRMPALVAAIVAAALACAPRSAQAQIKMEIVGPGSQLAAMAVSDLKNVSGDDDHRGSSAFVTTLRRDLELSGYFRILDPHAYIEDAQKSGFEFGQFNFADWRTINADFLVKGSVSVSGNAVKLSAYLYDVAQQRRMMGKNFTGSPAEVTHMARRFADSVLEATTGQRGPFDAKLAFVSTRAGRFKEVYTQSIDGQELYQVTNNPTINLFPQFDKSTRLLLFLSYKTFEPALYVADLQNRSERTIQSPHGRVIGGGISPDGSTIVAAIERGGATNLYVLDGNGGELRRLSDTGGINVSPVISPDGRMVAFTSDRSGTPQVWLMPLMGGAARRLTFSGDYNTTPAFSPRGDRIAYQSRSGGRFDIYTLSTSGGEPTRLTDGVGSNESPSWSPDGRYLAFSSTRGGRAKIYILMVMNQHIISPITEGNGDDTSPAWSWWLGE